MSAAGALLALALAACGTDAVGSEACRQVEEARCRKAPGCGLDLSTPVHPDTPEKDVEACIRYYRDACLHGLVTSREPSTEELRGCVDFIHGTDDCEVVRSPESFAPCAWLIPPDPPPDAGADPDASAGEDGATDAPPPDGQEG